MKRSAAVLVIIVLFAILAGCTQSQPATLATPVVTQVPATQSPVTEVIPATSAAPVATSVPVQTVTVIRYVVPDKTWKDSKLQITFATPETWAVTTHQMSLPDGSQGLEFKTDLVAEDAFYIITFPISRNQDQDYRNAFRKWTPVPDETTVTINKIVFDRFESTFNGMTKVGYVARKSSANDLGYSSVIYFIADDSRQFQQDDFEKVVQSFAYLAKTDVPAAAGEEIPRVR